MPLTGELMSECLELYREFSGLGEDYSALANKGALLQGHLNHFKEQFPQDKHFEPSIREQYIGSGLEDDIELILSYIDLNLNSSVPIYLKGRKEPVNHDAPLQAERVKLNDFRGAIETYLFWVLARPKINKSLLNRFCKLLQTGDTVISFNYDIVLEQRLYELGAWTPWSGYGIGCKLPFYCQISSTNQVESKITTLKPHGSISWEMQSPPDNDPSKVELKLFHGNEPFFPGYVKNEEKLSYDLPKIELGWQNPQLVLPSWIKMFNLPVLLEIWSKAFDCLRRADEIVFIGYSLPAMDSGANLLFGCSGLNSRKRKVLLVDTVFNEQSADASSENLKNQLWNRYKDVTGNDSIELFPDVDAYLIANS